jgi:hypothetical protein
MSGATAELGHVIRSQQFPNQAHGFYSRVAHVAQDQILSALQVVHAHQDSVDGF